LFNGSILLFLNIIVLFVEENILMIGGSERIMPYSSVAEVVSRFPKLKNYPKEAQQMFLKVLNKALKTYPDDEGKAIATAWAAINKKYGKQDQALVFDEFTVSFDMAAFKEFDGQIEIPTIFTREGVQNKGFKPWVELQQAADSLEGKPIVYGHPPEHRPVNPSIDQVIGEVDNIQAREEDHTLHGITRIFTDKAPSSWLQQLRSGSSREGSVGYWSISDYTPGVFKGDSYERVERLIDFDHYAVGIPKGACPVSEGCGLGFNESQDGESKTFSLDDLKGEGKVCLDKVKEFFIDILSRNRSDSKENEKNDGDDKEKMKIDEEERARLEQKYEKKITDLVQAKKEVEDKKTEVETAKTKIEEELQGFKDKETEQVEKQREQLVKEIVEHTEESAETYKDWTPKQLTHLRTKLVKDKREELIKPIVELTEEEPKAYENYSIGQLEHLHKVIGISKQKAEKATDKSALSPPSAEEAEAYVPSAKVAGKRLTIGDLSGTKPGE